MNVTTILIIVNVFAALAIIVLALMQTSKGDMGSAFGGGGSQGMFGARGSANFLSRSTSIMCAVFFISSLSLAYIYAKRAQANNSVVETSVIEEVNEIPSIESATPDLNDGVPSIELDQSTEAEVEQAVEELEQAVEEVPAESN